MKALNLFPIVGMLALLGMAAAQTATQERPKKEETTVTGCLMKGTQPNEYRIVANNVTYDLYTAANSNVNMAEHVGHKVEVTGTSVSEPNAANSASRTSEERVDVTRLKHISTTCP